MRPAVELVLALALGAGMLPTAAAAQQTETTIIGQVATGDGVPDAPGVSLRIA